MGRRRDYRNTNTNLSPGRQDRKGKTARHSGTNISVTAIGRARCFVCLRPITFYRTSIGYVAEAIPPLTDSSTTARSL
jgi:hypothetical protein